MRTGSEGSRRTEDELRAALPMLERHAPGADTVLRAVRDGGGRRAPGLVRRRAVPRRWPGWLAPVAAAAAVVGVISASLAISGVFLRHPPGTGPADSPGVFAMVPRYFVALPDPEIPGRAVVGATATGAVLGTVAPPKPYTVFTWVAAAGDGRTFVLAAAPGRLRGRPGFTGWSWAGRVIRATWQSCPFPRKRRPSRGWRCPPMAASSPYHFCRPTGRLAPGFRSSRSRPGPGGSGCGLAPGGSAGSPSA